MQSFVENSEIKVLISEKDLPKSKKKVAAGQAHHKLVQFSKKELDLLKKLDETTCESESDKENDEIEENSTVSKTDSRNKQKSLSLRELKDLKQQLGDDKFLCDILNEVELPQNEIVERNPELEERIQRLKAQQANREYNTMTRNVDSSRRHHEPTESIGYQSNFHMHNASQLTN
jgi:hypothetical protein